MLKRVLHTANQVVTHEETHTGTRELTIENTVNDNVDMLTVSGDSWQLAQKQGKNLLDTNPTKWKIGCGLSWAGTEGTKYNTYSTAGHEMRAVIEIPVLNNTKYGFFNANTANYWMRRIIESDDDGIGYYNHPFYSLGNYEQYTFTTTENTTKLAIELSTIADSEGNYPDITEDFIRSMQITLEQGEPTSYEPYQPQMPSMEYPSDIGSVDGEMVSCGWNLLDCSKILNTSSSGNNPAEYVFQNGVCIGRRSDGTYNQMALFFPAIYLEAGKTYVFSYSKAYYTVKSTGNTYKNGTITADVNMELSLNGKRVFREYGITRKVFTPSITGKYRFEMIAIFNFLSLTEFEVYNLMIKEIINTSKPYDHYRGNSTTLPTLRSLPDGTRDVLYVDRKNQRAWVERKIGETVLDGSDDEKWTLLSVYNGFLIIVSSMKIGNNQSGFCSHFEFGVRSVNKSTIRLGEGNNIMYFNDVFGIADNVDDWKVWLSGNPVTVQYPLADPIIEELPYSDYLLETEQYQTNIRMTGLNENLQPEITAQCKIL